MAKHRKITVEGRVWKYRIGTNHLVARAEDNNEKRVIDFSTLMNMDWNNIERAQWKGYFQITPADIEPHLKSG